MGDRRDPLRADAAGVARATRWIPGGGGRGTARVRTLVTARGPAAGGDLATVSHLDRDDLGLPRRGPVAGEPLPARAAPAAVSLRRSLRHGRCHGTPDQPAGEGPPRRPTGCGCN